MLKYFAALFILASGFCAAPLHRAPTTVLPPVDVEAERYAIYSLFLQHMFTDEPVKLLVVKNQTSRDFYMKEEWDRMELEPRWQAVVDDYKAKNAQPAAVENKFKVATPVTLISAQEVDQIFCEGCLWWKAFYKKYPKSPGLVTFSNVGFNAEMTYALVNVGYSCGGLCGRGGLVLLVKKDGNWTKEKELIAWVS